VAKTNEKVDKYMAKATKWQAEQKKLRKIVLECGLQEDYKWMHPCYTVNGKNVIVIHGFKDYCALLFFKGVLMKDPKKILIQQTKNVQEGRQIRFASIKEIEKLTPTLKAYIKEAVKIEESGVKYELKKTDEFDVPEELLWKFDEMPRLKEAFDALTPGRQRGYLLYFAGAKQSKTREDRIEKNVDKILDGIGLNDDYSKKK
jgi:uncharacterized protein YdeI (YjbR/CyaY-like superfamily)